MKIAAQIIQDFEKFEVRESSAHKHDFIKDRADCFTTYGLDPATTEREYGELIYGLVRAMKPNNVLELGTGMGFVSLMIAAALKENNGKSMFHTVDTRYLAAIKILGNKYGLNITPYCGSSSDFIADYPSLSKNWNVSKFDFVFFDTVQKDKGASAWMMLEKDLIAENGLMVFHDTSPYRFEEKGNPDAANLDYKSVLTEITTLSDLIVDRLDFWYSRGLTVIRLIQNNLGE